jgi:tetratricopeptide (TPR) repeat protein
VAGVRALGMEEPQVALQLPDAHLRSLVIAAYTQPLDYAAMPLIVRLVTAEKLEVREAARTAVARFGKNAIWQVRELYAEVTGQDADKRWDADKTAAELYAAIDRPAIEEAQTLLARGSAHYVAGRLDAMQRDYDRLLAQFPLFAEREKLAPGYAALGEKLLAEDELEPARAAFQRALRLAPEAEDNDALRAQLAFTEAELALTAGVVDLDGYERALRYDPDHAAAAAAKDRLSGARAARERQQQRLLTVGAIALLLGCCALLLRGRRKPTTLQQTPG